MRPDQERVKSVLIDSIVIMCQKGLNFNCELKLQGVIGITVDYNESFVIHINQTIEAATNSNTPANPSPSFAVKQEPQQQQINYGDSHSLSSGSGTPIKRESSQSSGSFMVHKEVKAELTQAVSQPLAARGQQGLFNPVAQSPQRQFQMALVPANNSQSRMIRPVGRAIIPRSMEPRMTRQQQPGSRSVRPQAQFGSGMGPSTSFQMPVMGHNQPRLGAGPATTRPKKVTQQRQKQYEDAYNDGYNQQQMAFQQQPMKRSRGAAQGRGGGGGGALKKARGGSPAFAGHVTQSSGDRTFKLISRYICDIDNCNASFTLKSNLRRHQKSKHPEYNLGDDDECEDDEGNEYY